MKAAILGPPLSGKSTLFEAVTSSSVREGDPTQEHLGTVRVPDRRLDLLAAMYHPKKITHATLDFVDVPGLSLDTPHGQAELRRHLPTVRQCDLLVLVVRDFANPAVPPYRNRIDRQADLNELRDELIFADLEIVANRIERIEKALSKPTKTHEQEKKELALLTRCREALEESQPLSTVIQTSEQAHMVSSFAFLTEKPAIVVYNVDEDRVSEPIGDPPPHAHAAVALCADIEAEISRLEPDEQSEFLASMGVEQAAADRLIRCAYDAMGLISFLTAGPEEVRAWPIPTGTIAVDAAARIHSDLARGFIRAETVAFDELESAGDMRSAKSAGIVRQEGKQYVVQDGDVMLIKFNV